MKNKCLRFDQKRKLLDLLSGTERAAASVMPALKADELGGGEVIVRRSNQCFNGRSFRNPAFSPEQEEMDLRKNCGTPLDSKGEAGQNTV
jgi:hypothetical protein